MVQNMPPYFFNYSVKDEPMLIIFDTWNSEKIPQQKLLYLENWKN